MPTLDPNLYTVAWIAPLEIEVQAARHMLDKVHSGGFPVGPRDDYLFHAGEIHGHNVVIATFAAGQRYGTNSAASLASHIRKFFPNLWFGLLVGVAAGLPNLDCSPPRDIRLGDVIVAYSPPSGDPPAIVPYGLGKQKRGDNFELLCNGHSLPQIQRIVGSAIGKLKAENREAQVILGYYRDIPETATKFPDPGQENDVLYLSDDNLPVPRQRRPDAERTRVWYGSIGSGDQLLKSSRDRDKLRDRYNVIGLEMEAAGVMNEIPVGNIRGVCDYGDELKNKDWQPYAAVMAAAFAKAVLREIPPKSAGPIGLRSVFTDEDKACLRDLLVTDPEAERRRIEATKGGLLDGSFRWVLRSAEFQKWHGSSQSQLLWIKGDPGKGKTMLMIGIINELLLQVQSQPSRSIAYFLCQATDSKLNNATSILRSVIYMLVQQQPHLISHLWQRYDTNSNLFESANAFYSLSGIFENMIHDSTQATIYLLVDALDECETGLSDLLKLIARTKFISAAQVKWIVSSRNRDEIEQELEFGTEEASLSLELNASHVSDAVAAYINHKVSRLTALQRNVVLLEQVKEKLLRKSDGTFLWVALVVEEMQKCRRSAAMVELLERLPQGLIPLYDRMLQQIKSFEDLDRESCILVLLIITFSYQTLHLHELCLLAGLHNQPHGSSDLEDIVSMCGSFLTIRDNYVHLIHQSAKDYLSDVKVSAAIFPSGPPAIHYRIFSESLKNLSVKLRRNIYNFDNPGAPASEIVTHQSHPGPLFDLRYSCTYWLDHFISSMSLERPESLDDQISNFFKRHFLHWLESLSLIGKLRHGILTLQKLSVCHTQHQAIFKEAERFASANAMVIQEAPLQTYSAALIFCPQKLLSKGLYWHQRFDFIKQAYVMQDSWNPCIQMLEDHGSWVNAVTFSPDGQIVASASSDETVRLWDTATGAWKRTLKGHGSPVWAVAFSPNGQVVASASSDKTIRLWDTATGAWKRTLKGHGSSVYAVAFSPDGQMVASASQDTIIRLWDVTTGAEKQTLEGHGSSVYAVAFSPDGQTVASASQDTTIRLWDVTTGAEKRTLKGHKGSVNAVTFSPNGQTVASASKDRTIRLWNLTTGAEKRILEGHGSSVFAVAFSPGGQIIASASQDTTIRLWDTAIGAEKRTLEGHKGSVNAVTFSPDGQTVASASEDQTIRLWNTATDAEKRTLEGHQDWVWAMAFSPDGQAVASASSDKTIRLWDTATGIEKRALKGHGSSVYAVAFSPDGQTVASASEDMTIRLWDVASGAEKQTLEGHKDWVWAVAFSPHGQVVASASEDQTIRLWDTATGAQKRILKGHRGSVNAVAFSPNKQTVASSSDDQTVRVWDAASGAEKRTLKGHGGLVNMVAFSPDGQTVASASVDKTIRLWDTVAGTQKQIYHSDIVATALWFSIDGRSLNTDHGSFPLDLQASNSTNNLIFVHEKWVCRNGQHLIWLPSQYRATCVLTRENTVILGHDSGALTFLWFNYIT